jgi:hypothetical protein
MTRSRAGADGFVPEVSAGDPWSTASPDKPAAAAPAAA